MRTRQTLRTAIIGAGRMASTIDDEIRSMDTWPSLKDQLPYSHAPCYQSCSDYQMVAACDLDETTCKTFCERWDVPRHYLDYREMIEKERPDVVSISTPADSHAELAIFAMEHGVRGVYCEKAMCCSLAEADAIVDCVARHDVKFMLGAQRRHHPNFRRARQIIESGRLGQLVSVGSWFSSSLLHSLSHCVDSTLYLAGDAEPVSVSGQLAAVGSPDEIEDRRITRAFGYDSASRCWNGDPGCLTYTAQLANDVLLFHLPGVMDVRFEAVCTNGYLRIVDNNDRLVVYERRDKTYSFDRTEEPFAPASPNLALVEDLARCIRTGATPLANEIVARYGMEILMGTAQSHLKSGSTLAIPLKNRAMHIPSH
ncbi:MAG: Gfo/Idh/MocA family oxidoreductase [Lentisphaeria bacterium]|nr:Gfo/Idh/MocA family oxidoreductase [Lentisphaeria bacterium]